MKMMFSYAKKYKWIIFSVLGLKFVGTVLELLIPYVLEYLVDGVAPTRSLSRVILWGLIMMVMAVLVRVLNVTANRRSVLVAKKSAYEIRRDLFRSSLRLSGNQMDGFGLPSLTSRMTSDSYNVQQFLQSCQTLGVRSPIMLIGGIVITLRMDRGLALILCIIAPIAIAAVVGVSMKGIPLYDKVQNALDKIVRVMRENISGIRVVKALSKEEYEKSRFHEANEAMTRRDRKAGIVMALPGPLMTLALNSGLTIVVVIGAYRVNSGVTQPGVILAFLTYFDMILMGVMSLNRILLMLSKANASAKRIQSVIEQPDELPRLTAGDAPPTARDGYIVFDHVSFAYGSADTRSEEQELALTDIDFSIEKGGSLGIIGATGCGKTTIVNLLMRFYDTTAGHVYIGGNDIRTYDKDDLHRRFGVVFQNDFIFADTLAENISFGRDVDEDGLRRAAEDAHAMEFIEGYEDLWQHRAAIHGANMSGGQKQRVLISRALAADPEILILDDSSSALDYRTDAALRRSIREHHSATTTVIIAQRVSSIMSLDHILMLDEGRIIGCGTHEELLQTCAPYRETYETQMGGNI